jgi:hypothetical protein
VSAAQEPRAAAPGEYLPDLLTERPLASPGDVPAGSKDLWGGERHPAGNGAPGEPLPSVENSPHWREIKT